MKGLHAVLAIAIVILFGINIYFMTAGGDVITIPAIVTEPINTQEPEVKNVVEISTSCIFDSDCSWQITNCCSENAGAQWQCINKQSKIECNELVLCPQVLSPKPQGICGCLQSRCGIK